MAKRSKPVAVASQDCSAPGCPLRYRYAGNNGQGWCRYHYGVQGSELVSEITRRLHVLAPVRAQLVIVNRLISSPVLQEFPYEVVQGLPGALQKRNDETFQAWFSRLQAHIEMTIQQRGVA